MSAEHGPGSNAGVENESSGAPDLASGLLADLLQLPLAGIVVFSATAAELRATVESLAESTR